MTNLVAAIIGFMYPMAVHNIPQFDAIFEVWRWSFLFGLGFLLFHAYLQSYAIKEVFSLKEVMSRALIYIFCTASVFANTMVFPSIIRYRVKQIIPKQEFYDDLHTYAFEDYRANLWHLSYYNTSKDHMEEYLSLYHENGVHVVLSPGNEKSICKIPQISAYPIKI